MLPIKLGREPLVEALFEMRFKGPTPAASVLPGVLFSKLEKAGPVERLPAADIPQQLRTIDLNLQFAPLVRVHWNQFMILISDRSLALACRLPYPGWASFKAAILKVLSLIPAEGLIDVVERFSLKYVNVIPADIGSASSVTDLDLRIGLNHITDQIYSVRAEIKKGDVLHLVQLASEASVTLITGETRSGFATDIDSIVVIEDEKFFDLNAGLADRIEFLHGENKQMFFSCLHDEAIKKLEPTYG
jgi:uncharacterized protein (TIGR04255 family)